MTASNRSHHGADKPQGSFWRSRGFIAFVGFAAIAVVLLWQEHSAHIVGVLPYLLLLACPLLHIFGHGGHGGHGSHRHQDPSKAHQTEGE